MGEERLAAFLSAFARLPFLVIWKWDGARPAGLSDNVVILDWVPQQALLSHANLRVFVTHGGLLSLQEAGNEKIKRSVKPSKLWLMIIY